MKIQIWKSKDQIESSSMALSWISLEFGDISLLWKCEKVKVLSKTFNNPVVTKVFFFFFFFSSHSWQLSQGSFFVLLFIIFIWCILLLSQVYCDAWKFKITTATIIAITTTTTTTIRLLQWDERGGEREVLENGCI